MAKRLARLGDWTSVFLGTIERVGNALPHPATIFAILALLTVVASAVAATMDLEVVHPGTGATVRPANLLTIDALDPYGKIPEFKFCAVRVEKIAGRVGSG